MPRRERPLDSGESELLQFAADLRRLRELAGSPTYRELSRRAHYSAAALSEAAGGRKLPTLAVTMAYVQACEGDPEEWEARWRAALQHDMGQDGQAPYVGLKPFQATDAHRFFGRDRLITELLDLVAERRFVGVFGASGVGKSSVLRAGLVARTELPVVLLTPGADPRDELAAELAKVREEPKRALYQALEDPANLDHLTSGLLVVVDQFEELFTLCRDNRQREWLIMALTSGAHVVIGVRADFYGHCARYPVLVDALRGGQVMVGAMSADELRQAVTEPAQHAGAKVEAALLARLMSDAVGQASVLPLLSHALAETWARRDGMTLTLAGYEQAGGLEHAVAQTAQDVYTSLNSTQRKEAREILLRLIAVGDGTEDTKRKVRRGELNSRGDVLDKLVAARLLTLDGDGVELAHEALIRCWPLLREWIAQDREGLRVHRRLTDAADAWESLGRDPGALYRGVRLEMALDWRAHSNTELNERERAFLAASEAAEEETRTAVRKRTLRGRWLIVGLVVLLIVAMTATVVALDAQRTAQEERNKALALRAIGEAGSLRASNPALAVQVSLAAYQIAGVEDALRGLRYDMFTGQVLRSSGSEVTAMVLTPALQLLSGHRDGAVLVTDLRDAPGPREPVPMTKHTGAVVAMAMSNDGRTVVTAGEDGFVHIIDVSLGKPSEIGAFQAHADGITAVGFQGDRLVTAGQDGLVKMWEGVRNASQKLVRTHSDAVPKMRHMAFSPDGNSMVAVTVGGDAQVFQVGGGGELYQGEVLPQPATAVAFEKYGGFATASGRAAGTWDIDSNGALRKKEDVPGEGGQVVSVAWGDDGKTLVTTNEDGTTRLWDTNHQPPMETTRLEGHQGPVTVAALMRGADTVVTGGADGTLRLWAIGGRNRFDRACERAVPRMTADEWNRFFPGVEFKPPCPPL